MDTDQEQAWVLAPLHQMPEYGKLLTRLAQLLHAGGDASEAAQLHILLAEGEADSAAPMLISHARRW